MTTAVDLRIVRTSVLALATGALVSAISLATCAKQTPAASTEPPTLSFTHWTEKTEVFAEHPPLVAGQNVRFAVHLTTLADFKPISAGRPAIEFKAFDGQLTTLTGNEPSRPGAFRVEGKMPAAGTYTWALLVTAPNVSDRHELGTVTVYPDEASAVAAATSGASAQPAIAYLKEQQWANEFATAAARTGEMRISFRAPATIVAIAGGEAVVSAPAAGRVAPGALPALGSVVRPGQALGHFEPRLDAAEDRATLVARVEEARITVEAARVERDRADRLLAEKAVPARRLEEARHALATAEAQLRAAEARLQQRDQTLRAGGGAAAGNTFALRAPIAGRIVTISATPGASYDEGAPLFRIVRTDRVLVDAQVPTTEVGRASQIQDVAIEFAGEQNPIAVRPLKILNAGVIDPGSHALPLQIEADNRDGTLVVGRTGTAVLYLRQRVHGLTIPAAAVIVDTGRPLVFVQLAGESFARRPIEIGARDGDRVSVTSGLQAGDRVVTRGAYEILLAAASKGLPAEGHVH